ncbi:hypothetical protein HW49_11120 [Porphyromonadaceae bacterium COT-184 OH4590]|nr:hypothetical protein HW49_11120 [Porphyromonadaceae bacterium COT-184 OH4590]
MRFSGHETFICKQFWLKKGYDFLVIGNKFGDDNAVVELGVGKNMVSAIGFWMKAFGLCSDKWELSEMAHYIFGGEGKDKYLEDIGTIWLLHYLLVKENYASIYSLFFNGFRRGRIEFTSEQLHKYIESIAREDSSYNVNTITADIMVLQRMYQKTDKAEIRVELEDMYSGIFNDLQLMSKLRVERYGEKGLVDLFRISNEDNYNLPAEIFLFSILDNYPDMKTISFKELEVGNNSPGIIFALNKEGLHSIIERITEKYNNIVFSSSAGVQVLQFKSTIDKWEILNDYYAGN